MMNNYCIYRHISPSGKVYIGQTCQDPNKRWLNGKGYKKSTIFNRAIEKYGWSNISKCCRGKYKQAYKFKWEYDS